MQHAKCTIQKQKRKMQKAKTHGQGQEICLLGGVAHQTTEGRLRPSQDLNVWFVQPNGIVVSTSSW